MYENNPAYQPLNQNNNIYQAPIQQPYGQPYGQQPYPGIQQPYMQQNNMPPLNSNPYQNAGNIYQSPVQVVVVENGMSQYPRLPVPMRCPACQTEIVTVVTIEPGGGTYCCCVTICLFSLILGLIPFCVPDCQDAHHSCPNCMTRIGSNKFLFN